MHSQQNEFLMSPQTKPPRTKNSEAGTRQVRYNWNQEEIRKLIAAVEKRPGLWDASSADYKLAKNDGWREVVDELGIQIEPTEAKSKWGALRITFKANLAKLRTKKSGQGAESSTVLWQYFKEMMFLEASDVHNSTPSTSTMDLDSVTNDDDILNDFLLPPSTSEVGVSKRRKRQCEMAPPSPPSSATIARLDILNAAVTALNTTDKNSTFCDYLTAQMRALPEYQANRLRNSLNRTLLNFLDEIELEGSQESPVQYVDEHGHDITEQIIANVESNPDFFPSVVVSQHPRRGHGSNESLDVIGIDSE